MPSLRAMALTRRHRRELAALTQLTSQQTTRLANTLQTGDVDDWWTAGAATSAQRIAATGYTVAAASAARYLRTHAAIEGHTVSPVRSRANLEQIDATLRGAGPGAFKHHMSTSSGDFLASRAAMVGALAGSTQYLSWMGDRDTVMATFADSQRIVGWQRITSGSECAFCAMLASRGAVYSEAGVDFQAHNHCSCSAEPLYEREPTPQWVEDLRSEWNETTEGLSGRDALNAFRRAREGTNV